MEDPGVFARPWFRANESPAEYARSGGSPLESSLAVEPRGCPVKSKVVGLALVAGAFLVLAASAEAGKWSYGNGPTDIWAVHPGSGGPFDVCTTQVHGRVGLHGFGDPD